MKLDWNFQRGGGRGGCIRKNLFHGGGMNIFWNHTLWLGYLFGHEKKQFYLNSMDSYKLKQMGLHEMSVPAIIIIIFWSRGLYIANGSFKADEGAWGVMGLPLWPVSPSTVNKPPNLAMSPHTGLSMHSSHCVKWLGRKKQDKKMNRCTPQRKLPQAEICLKHL